MYISASEQQMQADGKTPTPQNTEPLFNPTASPTPNTQQRSSPPPPASRIHRPPPSQQPKNSPFPANKPRAEPARPKPAHRPPSPFIRNEKDYSKPILG